MRRFLASLAMLAGTTHSWAFASPQLPVEFEANRGQHEASVRFLSRTGAMQVALTDSGAVFALPRGKPGAADKVTLHFAGAQASRPDGEGQTGHRANYFLGGESGETVTDVPNYERVVYRSVYPGVDAVFYGRSGTVEYDLVLRPGANPRRIELGFEGARRIELDANGDLLLHTSGGVLRQHKPVVFQERDGRRQPVASRYRVLAGHKVRFDIAAYDSARALTVDPLLSYSTYLGGSGSDTAAAVAVDAAGSAYIAGQTASTNFPAVGAYQASLGGTGDIFVAKLNPQGNALVYSTYIGARRATSQALAIAIDAGGSAYVAGLTSSNNYPVTSGAYSAGLSGGGAVVTKLAPAGNALAYSTYLKGITPAAIKVDAAGSATVAGDSQGNLPTTPGAWQTALPVAGSGAIARLNAAGSALLYASYLGAANGTSRINGLALDAGGNAYLTGSTTAAGFPVTPGAFQGAIKGASDAFVTKLNASGSALLYSTFLGGTADDHGVAIAVDAAGKAYVAGDTGSADFPRVDGLVKTLPQYDFVTDAFVTVVAADGRSVPMSTYLGGTACLSGGQSCTPEQPNDGATAIAVDPSGNHIFVAGHLSSVSAGWLFDAVQRTLAGAKDGFVARIETDPFTGRIFNIRWATRLGGDGDERASGLGIDAQGNAYVVGSTTAANHPTTPGALRVAAAGGGDVFVAKVNSLGVPVRLESDCTGALRASLALNATGSITFTDNGVAVGTAPIQDGRAVLRAAVVPGTHKYTAIRSSDGAVSRPVYCKAEQ